MADKDTGTEKASAPDAGPADVEGADEAPAAEPQDAKTRFREALARKQDSAHRSAEGRQNTGVVHGSEVKAGGKRTFRRKTG